MIKRRRLLFFVVVAMGALLHAGNTGKIAGSVVDKQTGEPLIGANVMVDGTNLGGATDADGNYFILQVLRGPTTSWPLTSDTIP